MLAIRFVCRGLSIVAMCASAAVAENDRIREHELKFTNDGLSFAATLFLPAGDGPFPAVAFSHGSAREHRRLPGYHGLARKIAAEGLAVLLWDKRGVGDSEGEYEETPWMETAAADLQAAVELLRGRSEIDGSRIGVFGHSQGAWIGPLAAATDRRIAFVVALSGGGVSILEQVLFQQRQELLADGVDPDAATLALAAARAPAIASIEVPVFVLLGARDVQTPTSPTAVHWIEAFDGSRAGLLTLHILGDEGHALWELTANGPEVRQAFWEPLASWLRERELIRDP